MSCKTQGPTLPCYDNHHELPIWRAAISLVSLPLTFTLLIAGFSLDLSDKCNSPETKLLGWLNIALFLILAINSIYDIIAFTAGRPERLRGVRRAATAFALIVGLIIGAILSVWYYKTFPQALVAYFAVYTVICIRVVFKLR